MKTNNTNFSIKLLIILAVQTLSISFILKNHIGFVLIGFILLGAINAHTIQIIHQCCHYTGYSSKALNDIVGRYLSFFVLINFKQYRKVHFFHHRNLGTDLDSEVFGFNELNKDTSPMSFANVIFGIPKYKKIITNLKEKEERENSCKILLSLFAVSVLCFSFDYQYIFIGWMLSLIFITEPIHFLIEIPEHFGCKKISLERYENTRTLNNVSFFARWFTNWNNFHVEHHLNPWALPENLSRHHEQLKNSTYNQNLNSYVQFYLYFLNSIFSKSKQK